MSNILFLIIVAICNGELPSFASSGAESSSTAPGLNSIFEFVAENAVTMGGNSAEYMKACNSSADPKICHNLQDCATVAGTAVKDLSDPSRQRFYVQFTHESLKVDTTWKVMIPARCFHNGSEGYNGYTDPSSPEDHVFSKEVTIQATDTVEPSVADAHSFVDTFGGFKESYGRLSMSEQDAHRYVSVDHSNIIFKEKVKLNVDDSSSFTVPNPGQSSYQVDVSFADLKAGAHHVYKLATHEIVDEAGNSFCQDSVSMDVKKTTSMKPFDAFASQTMSVHSHGMYPHSTNVSKQSNVIFQFEHDVSKAGGRIQFCPHAFPNGRCNVSAVSMDMSTCVFVPDHQATSGKLVACKFPQDLQDDTTYYVGMDGTVFDSFAGVNQCIVDTDLASSSTDVCEINSINLDLMFHVSATGHADATHPELIDSSEKSNATAEVVEVGNDYSWAMWFTKHMQIGTSQECQPSNGNAKFQKVSYQSDLGDAGDIDVAHEIGSAPAPVSINPPTNSWLSGHTYTVRTNNQSIVDKSCKSWEPKDPWTFGVAVNVLDFVNAPLNTAGVERSFALKFQTDALNGALKIGNPDARIEFTSACHADVPKSIRISDQDQVFIQGEFFVVSPVNFWHDNCEYKFKIPKGAFHLSQESVEYTFRTVASDHQAPDLIYSVPAQDAMLSRRELNTKPIELYFSQEVQACFPDFDDYDDKSITLSYPSGEAIEFPVVQKVQGNTRSTRNLHFAKCESNTKTPCIEFGDNSNDHSWVLKLYPNGKGNLMSDTNIWAVHNQKYTVAIPGNVLCGSGAVNVQQQKLKAQTVSFSTLSENGFPSFDVLTPGDISGRGFVVVTDRNPKLSSGAIRGSSSVDWIGTSPHDGDAVNKWSIQGRNYICGAPLMQEVNAFWEDGTDGTQQIAIKYDMDVQKVGNGVGFHLIPSTVNPKVPDATSINVTTFTIVGDTVLLDVTFGTVSGATTYVVLDAGAVKSKAEGCGGLATTRQESGEDVVVNNGKAKPIVLAVEFKTDSVGDSYFPYTRWESANRFSMPTGSCIAKGTRYMRLHLNNVANMTSHQISVAGVVVGDGTRNGKIVDIDFGSRDLTIGATNGETDIVVQGITTDTDATNTANDDTTISVKFCDIFIGEDQKTVMLLPAANVNNNAFQSDHEYTLKVPAGAFFDDHDEPSPAITKVYSTLRKGPFPEWSAASFKAGTIQSTKSSIVMKFNEDVTVSGENDAKYSSGILSSGDKVEVSIYTSKPSANSDFSNVVKFKIELDQIVAVGQYVVLPFRDGATNNQQQFNVDTSGSLIDSATNYTTYIDIRVVDPCVIKGSASGVCIQRGSGDSSLTDFHVEFKNVNTSSDAAGVEGTVGTLEEVFHWPSTSTKIDQNANHPKLNNSYAYIMLSQGGVQHNSGTMTFGEKNEAATNVVTPVGGDGTFDDNELELHGFVPILLPETMQYSKTYELTIPKDFFKKSAGAGEPELTWPAEEIIYTYNTIDQPGSPDPSESPIPKLVDVQVSGFESSDTIGWESWSEGKVIMYFDQPVSTNSTDAKMFLTRKSISSYANFDSESMIFIADKSDPTTQYASAGAISNDGSDAVGSITYYDNVPTCRHFSSNLVAKAGWASSWKSDKYVEETCFYKVEVRLFGTGKHLVPGQSSKIYFNMDEGFFVHKNDNSKAVVKSGYGSSSSHIWNIRESDVTKPSVLSVGPLYDGTLLKLDDSLQLWFSEKILFADPSMVDINDGSSVNGCDSNVWTCKVDGHSLQIRPASGSLKESTTYTVSITSTSAITDRAHNILDNTYSGTATTHVQQSADDSAADLEAPSGSDHFPAASSTNNNPSTTFTAKISNVKTGLFSRANIADNKHICLYVKDAESQACNSLDCEVSCEGSVAKIAGSTIRLLGSDSIAFSFSSQYSMKSGTAYAVFVEAGLFKDDLEFTNAAGSWWSNVEIGCKPSNYDTQQPTLLGWTSAARTLESTTQETVEMVWSEPIRQAESIGASLNFTDTKNKMTTDSNSPFVRVELSANGTLISGAGSFEAIRVHGGDTRKSALVSDEYRFIKTTAVVSNEQTGYPIVVETFASGNSYDGFFMAQHQGLIGSQALNSTQIPDLITSGEFSKMYTSQDSSKLNIYPANEQAMISHSQVIAVKFNESVSAGSGTVTVAGQSYMVPRDVGSSIFIKGATVYIIPRSDYITKAEVSFVIQADTFQKKDGDIVSKSESVQGKFRVIDRDIVGPKVVTVAPVIAEHPVNRRSSIMIEFDQELLSSSPSISCKDQNGNTETLNAHKVDGKKVYFPPCGAAIHGNKRNPRDTMVLSWGNDVFKDVNGNPMEPGQEYSYTVELVEDFDSVPKVILSSPRLEIDSSADKPMMNRLVHAMIIFDSNVHMNNDAKVEIKYSNGGSGVNCLVPENGNVEKFSNLVFVKCRAPFEQDGQYEMTVSGFFNDYETEQESLKSYFTIGDASFAAQSGTGATSLYDRGVVHHNGNHYLLGGRSGDNTPSGDVFKSKDGVKWDKVGSFATPRYGHAFAATADRMFILGGCGAGDSDVTTNSFLTSSDGGETWADVVVEQGQTVSMKTHLSEDTDIFVEGKPFPPANMCGASLVVYDGSKLMLVGGQLEDIYVSLDSEAKQWAWFKPTNLHGQNPFLNRMQSTVWQASNGQIVAAGGHMIDESTVADVLVSDDLGRHWSVATANMHKDMYVEVDGKKHYGPGSHAALAMTGADTLMVIGGEQNSTVALDWVWSSFEGEIDSVAPTVTRSHCPTDRHGHFVVEFSEPVRSSLSSWNLQEVSEKDGSEVHTPVVMEPLVWNADFTQLTVSATTLSDDKKYDLSWDLGSVVDYAENRIAKGNFQCQLVIPQRSTAVPLGYGTPSYKVASNASFDEVSSGTNLCVDMQFEEFEPVGSAAINMHSQVGKDIEVTKDTCERIHNHWCCELPSGQHLTEGAEYSITIPKEQFRNTISGLNNTAHTFGQKFSVLSGHTFDATYHETLIASQIFVFDSNRSSDVAPAIMSRNPPNGAKDVGYHADVFQTIVFDQSIQISNVSQLISLKKYNASSTEWVNVFSTNSTNEVNVLAHNDTLQIQFPTLEKDAVYCVDIPNSVVNNGKVDFSGVECAGHQFTTLKGLDDNIRPAVLAQSPKADSSVLGTIDELTLFFSKAISSGPEKITVGTGNDAINLTDASIQNSIVTVQIENAALNPEQNTLVRAVTVESGFVQSADGNLANDEHLFQLSTSRVLKPVISDISVSACSDKSVASGVDHYAGCPEMFVVDITFSHAVKLADGAEVIMTSSYGSPDIVLKAADLHIHNALVSGLVHGERGETYTVSISNSSFVDPSGNYASDGCLKPLGGNAPTVCGQTYEIEPLIKFRRHSGNDLSSPVSGASALVTEENEIIIVGGNNGTHVQDMVYKMDTHLPTHCHAAPDVWSSCSESPCNGPADRVVQFDGQVVSAPFSSGQRVSVERLVKQPSFAGLPCTSHKAVDASKSNFACSGSYYDKDLGVFTKAFLEEGKGSERKCVVAWRDALEARGQSFQADCVCPACFTGPTVDTAGANAVHTTQSSEFMKMSNTFVHGAGQPVKADDVAFSHLVEHLRRQNVTADRHDAFYYLIDSTSNKTAHESHHSIASGVFSYGEVMPMCGNVVNLQDGTPITSHWASNTFQCVAQHNNGAGQDWYANWDKTNDDDVHCDVMPCFEAPAPQHYYASSDVSGVNYEGNQCVDVRKDDYQCTNAKNPFAHEYSNSTYCMHGFSNDTKDNTCEIKCKSGYHRSNDAVQVATCSAAKWEYPQCQIHQCGDDANPHPDVLNSNFKAMCTDVKLGHSACEAPFTGVGECNEAKPGVCDFKCNPGYEWKSTSENIKAGVVNMQVQCRPTNSALLESAVAWYTQSTNIGTEGADEMTFVGDSFDGCVLRTCKRVEFVNAMVNEVKPAEYATNYPVAKFDESRTVVCDAGHAAFVDESSAIGTISTDVKCTLANTEDETSDLFMSVIPAAETPVEAPAQLCRKLTCPTINLDNTVSPTDGEPVTSIAGQFGQTHELKCAVGYEHRGSDAVSVEGTYIATCSQSDDVNERSVAFTNQPICVPKNCNLCSVNSLFTDASEICSDGNLDILLHGAVRKNDLLQCKDGTLRDNEISCNFGQPVFACVPNGGDATLAQAVTTTIALSDVPAAVFEDPVIFDQFVDSACDSAFASLNQPDLPRDQFSCKVFVNRMLRSLAGQTLNLQIAFQESTLLTGADITSALENPKFLADFQKELKKTIENNEELAEIIGDVDFGIDMATVEQEEVLFVQSSATAMSVLMAFLLVFIQ